MFVNCVFSKEFSVVGFEHLWRVMIRVVFDLIVCKVRRVQEDEVAE